VYTGKACERQVDFAWKPPLKRAQEKIKAIKIEKLPKRGQLSLMIDHSKEITSKNKEMKRIENMRFV